MTLDRRLCYCQLVTQLATQNLSQSLVQELLALIQNGDFAPGDSLPTQKELSEKFGIGRGAVREAIQSLVSMGMIEVRPRLGAKVVATDSSAAVSALAIGSLLEDRAVDDLYEFRGVLEVEIAGKAAVNRDDNQRERIAAALEAYGHALTLGLPTYLRDIEFHQALAEACNNRVYLDVLSSLNEVLSKARHETQHLPWAVKQALVEHREIFDAVMKNDVNGARSAMARHIASARLAVDKIREQSRTQKTEPTPGDAGIGEGTAK